MEEGDQASKSLAVDSNCGSVPTSCVMLDSFLNLSDPQFPHQWKKIVIPISKDFCGMNGSPLHGVPSSVNRAMSGSLLDAEHGKECKPSWTSCS